MTASVTGDEARSRGTLGTGFRLFLGAAGILVVLVGAGWLITRTSAHAWPLSSEDGVNRVLAQHRNPLLNSVSAFFSTVADTQSAIAVSVVAVVAIRVLTRRWPEALFVAAALVTEVVIFLLTTVAIERGRPAVPHLDHAPPTSSFPSGHTAAATALYVALAVVARRHNAPWPVWLLAAMPCAVGLSRLYRGMHHPSDVVAGVVLGLLCVLLADRVVLAPPPGTGPRRRLSYRGRP